MQVENEWMKSELLHHGMNYGGYEIMNNERLNIQKKLLAIAIPLILSNLVSQLQMLIDRMFLGRLDITRMSAVSNASSPIWTTMNIVFSLAVGSAILISQAIGAGDNRRARELTASLFKYANVPAVLLFMFWTFLPRQVFTLMGASADIIDMCVDYSRFYAPVFLFVGVGSAVSTLLQVSEKTQIMVLYGVSRSLINIILDYIMIFGHFGFPRMEVAGAALATTIAELVGHLIVLIYVIGSKELTLKPTISEILGARLSPYITAIRMGLPSACEDFAWNLGSLYLIVMLNQISSAASGIYSIVFGMELVPVCIIACMGTATLTLAGQETGKKNHKGVGTVVSVALVFSFILSAVMLALFLIFPGTITGWFTTDPGIISKARLYLLIVGVDLFPKSMNIVVGSGIKGHGNTKWMLGTQIFGTLFVIGVSTILVLGLHRGIAALFCLVVADETLRSGINLWRLRKIAEEQPQETVTVGTELAAGCA